MQYLSDEWFEAADAAVRASPAPPAEIVVDQHIDGGPSWRVVIGPEPSVQRLPVDPAVELPEADAVFHQSRRTAEAIARGDTDSHQAFLLGQVRFSGDIDRLLSRREALAWLQQALAPVMNETVWT